MVEGIWSLKNQNTRQTAVAGKFYPGDATKLEAQTLQYLEQAKTDLLPPKAMIVPHAGYIYSGSVAASAYATLLNRERSINRVVVIGPSHRVAFDGIAIPTASAFDTPLGTLPLASGCIAELGDLPGVRAYDLPHLQEHCLEVQLPFLQIVLDEFELLPLIVGRASAEQVAAVLDRLWDGPETLIVVSSDLSHYHDYPTAKALDGLTTSRIEALNGEALSAEDVCGYLPVQGLLQVVKARNLAEQTLDVRNSGDTAGSRDRVVGYGAYVFN
jgi:AmmeMemoRadiSam system protein B